jgi:hypothetical protein
MYLLFPGRHQLLTNFQFYYLHKLINEGLQHVTDVDGKKIETKEKVDAIIFAVTSANHSNTRRNPLPFYLRSLAVQEFSRELFAPCYIYGVDDVGNVPNFGAYTLKRIKHESEGMFDLNPSNTLVICSTRVLQMYEQLKFTILPCELSDRGTWSYQSPLPWTLVEDIAKADDWNGNESIVRQMHTSSRELWEKYKLAEKVKLLFRDAMISDDGDITSTRDYNSYVRQMDEIAGLKYEETAPFIRAGRIGDIGCAVGSWVKLACRDERFLESDFYGIEVARQLFDICNQRKHNREFENHCVFFSQRNAVTGLVFDKNSMNTIHTSSLTHEIESYGSRLELLQFIRNRYEELCSGGVWINRDVVGPCDKDKVVLMKLNKFDGRNEDYQQPFEDRAQLSEYLKGLSTYGRFLRFAGDFRKHEGYHLGFKEITIDGVQYIQLTLKDACEFMSRKDYVDNWQSEMHETFCFWDYDEWTANLELAGFKVLPESHAFTSEWIIENRLKRKAELFENCGGLIQALPYPDTHMILVAERI